VSETGGVVRLASLLSYGIDAAPSTPPAPALMDGAPGLPVYSARPLQLSGSDDTDSPSPQSWTNQIAAAGSAFLTAVSTWSVVGSEAPFWATCFPSTKTVNSPRAG
jgi:hypothetical protein